jgi:L-ascorbate metabolism protein UlaG (beta-lactamase superfamily)
MTESLVITRIDHSCHLIQIGGLTVLTDPWFPRRPFTTRASRSPSSRSSCRTWTRS